MTRVLFVLFVFAFMLFVGCGLDTIEHVATDAGVDAPGSGSGSDEMNAVEPSPQDGHLEILVVGASLLVVLAPASAGATRRRRQELKDEVAGKPHFS
jgi:hypothetical protein